MNMGGCVSHPGRRFNVHFNPGICTGDCLVPGPLPKPLLYRCPFKPVPITTTTTFLSVKLTQKQLFETEAWIPERTFLLIFSTGTICTRPQLCNSSKSQQPKKNVDITNLNVKFKRTPRTSFNFKGMRIVM